MDKGNVFSVLLDIFIVVCFLALALLIEQVRLPLDDTARSCNEFVNIADVLFDCAHVAAGGVYIAHAMGATIGPAFFYGFNQVCSSDREIDRYTGRQASD